MEIIKRERCVYTQSNDLEFLYKFKKFPVFMGCVNTQPSEDIITDMNWYISKSSGSIQLNELVPLDVLYQSGHSSGVIGKIWKDHHRKFAEFLKKFNCNKFFEIGGAHGLLSKEYHDLQPDADWTILEPNPKPADGVKAKFIKGFFDEKFPVDKDVDAFIHSHVLEHLYDPAQILDHLSQVVPKGKHHFFSLPNLEKMLKKKYNNCLNFEHTLFITEPYVEYLLGKNGFKIISKEYFMDAHSIFYATVREETTSPTLPSLYEKNKNIFLDWTNHYEQQAKNLNDLINTTSDPIFIFGAHIFTLYLFGFGLKKERIAGVLDNDPNKQGKRLYGTDLYVSSPEILNDYGNVNIILKTAFYNEEIKNDISSRISNRVTYWE